MLQPKPRTFDHLLGKDVVFDLDGKRVKGRVAKVDPLADIQPGAIPDATLTILGASGRTVVVSLLSAWVRLAMDEQ